MQNFHSCPDLQISLHWGLSTQNDKQEKISSSSPPCVLEEPKCCPLKSNSLFKNLSAIKHVGLSQNSASRRANCPCVRQHLNILRYKVTLDFLCLMGHEKRHCQVRLIVSFTSSLSALWPHCFFHHSLQVG